ncbi:hypothetical protein JCM8547_004473 [Rhodosporidiobolus lusitaniae]
MPPKPSTSSNSTQQSLSSFFQPRSAPAASSSTGKRKQPEVVVLSDSSDEEAERGRREGEEVKRAKREEGEQHGGLADGTGATTSSSTISNVKPPPAPSAPSSSSAKKLQSFAFSHSSPSAPAPLSPEAAKRREQFTAKLSLLIPVAAQRRGSSYLQKEHYLAAVGSEASGSGGGGASGVGKPLFLPDGEGEEEEEGEEEWDGVGKGKGKARGGSRGGGGSKGKGKGKARAEESDEEMDGFEDDDEGDSEGAASSSSVSRFAKLAAKGKSAGKEKKGSRGGGGKGKEKAVRYTPLEQQVLQLKKENPGVLLVFEVGYKFRFFGADSQAASRTLNIACFPSHSMLTASIPTHRLDIHVRRLLNAGFKVGVVRQIETAALKKAGDNRSAPFTRKLTALYTSATYVDELGVDGGGGGGAGGSGLTATLMCLVEDKLGKQPDAKVRIGMVAVVPSTGAVVYDEFDDGLMRAELETRMLHLQPSEMLLQKDLSSKTESMVQHLVGRHNTGAGDFTTRIERIPKRSNAAQATSVVSEFYAKARKKEKGKWKGKEVSREPSEIVLDDTDEEGEGGGEEKDGKEERNGQGPNPLDLPKLVLVALSSLITHLSSFSLDSVFLHRSSFSPFASRTSMTLNGNTVANLELLRNSTDFKEQGSLISVLDRCKTPMGKRLLRRWVTKPLLSLEAVAARHAAISEIHSLSSSLTLQKLRDLLRTLPDLERGLSRIHFGRASPNELLRMLEALKRVGSVFDEVDSPGEEDEDEEMEEAEEDEGPVRKRAGGRLKSELLRSVVRELPKTGKTVEELVSQVEVKSARDNKKESLFVDEGKYPELQACKQELTETQDAMQEELKSARKILRKPALQFTKVSQEEYLLEVKVVEAKKIVPDDWIKINATKQVGRYRTPRLQKKLERLEQAREKVAAAANAAFLEFLQEVASHHDLFRTSITHLSTADCLFSLSVVALSNNWVRPTLVDEPGMLEIEEGRHPIIEAVSREPFVPNTVEFGDRKGGGRRQMVLTGLNMGGKSSLSRSIALIALLIGSFVPATSCRTSLFDSIFTRMGASDDLARGRSTFVVELSETSEILRLATPRSLIVLDELGRGTSTNDGQAIAEAVLEWIVREKRSLCVFVTHYPSLGALAKRYPSVTANHMACLEQPSSSPSSAGEVDVTFLYKLAAGLASQSHGLNVARIADLPQSVLEKAREKSRALERETEEMVRRRRRERLEGVMRDLGRARKGRLEGGEGRGLVERCRALLEQGVA